MLTSNPGDRTRVSRIGLPMIPDGCRQGVDGQNFAMGKLFLVISDMCRLASVVMPEHIGCVHQNFKELNN